jgi:CRISPR/Cas system CSM-associated protein Csm3 (group 7 of RAMP superfamily)
MKNGRIILKAQLQNLSPMGIGSGRDDRSDRDVVTTEYAFENNGVILPPERFLEAKKENIQQLPFIPATSFLGKVFRQFDLETHPEVKKYWGESEENASFIDCSDILLTELPGDSLNATEIRDGIRLDSAKGTVAQGAKFDYELLVPGAKFELTMLFRVEEDGLANYDLAIKIASDIATIIEKGIDLGAKSTVGYGRVKGSATLYEIDFENPAHFQQWINNDLFKNKKEKASDSLLLLQSKSFEIEATFRIKNSLIIRSYSNDPKAPDSTHLKSGGKNILSGSSIKGALRGRAERILNTIQTDRDKTENILAGLFGNVEKEINNKQKVKKDGYTVPSRVFIDEVPIDEVKEEIQTRIQIDRFTGGTVDGALIEEVPLFPVKNKDQIKNFRIRVADAKPLDKGLMLLLLKDLWTADLPIGGEKSIGRGVLDGVSATVFDGDEKYTLLDDLKNPEKTKKLQIYVDALHNRENDTEYQKRIDKYKTRKP